MLSLAIPPSVSLVETGLMIDNIQEGKPARIILKPIAEQNLKSLQPSVLCSGKERGDGGDRKPFKMCTRSPSALFFYDMCQTLDL